MEVYSLSYYRFYNDLVSYIFLAIGLIGLIYWFNNAKMKSGKDGIYILLIAGIVFILGNYPMIQTGADRDIYCEDAIRVANGGNAFASKDIGMFYLTKLLTLLPVEWYFFLQSLLYTLGIYYFTKSSSKTAFGLLFLGMILNFQFVSYGVNTIRAGLAASTLLVAIACRNKQWLHWILILVAISIHKSFALPAFCYVISTYFDKTRLYFIIWLLAIPVSFLADTYFQELIAANLEDERASNYLLESLDNTLYKVGFRFDFILYSCLPIFLGYYYIYKKRFNDSFYKVLYNTYILANTFWILVIRSNFSDRFAYLSWFIYPMLLLYPIAKQPALFNAPHKLAACIILFLTLFRTLV